MEVNENTNSPIPLTWQRNFVLPNERVNFVLGKERHRTSIVAVTNALLRYHRILEAERGKHEPNISIMLSDDVVKNLERDELHALVAILRHEIPDSQATGTSSAKSFDPSPGKHGRIIHALHLPTSSEMHEVVLKGGNQPNTDALNAFHRTRALELLIMQNFPEDFKALISVVPIYAQIEYEEARTKRIWQILPRIEGKLMNETAISKEPETYNASDHTRLLKMLTDALQQLYPNDGFVKHVVGELQNEAVLLEDIRSAIKLVADAYGAGPELVTDFNGSNIVIDVAGRYHLIDR